MAKSKKKKLAKKIISQKKSWQMKKKKKTGKKIGSQKLAKKKSWQNRKKKKKLAKNWLAILANFPTSVPPLLHQFNGTFSIFTTNYSVFFTMF